MKVLDLFDTYFLVLMIIQGLIVGLYDASAFKKKNAERAGKKARTIGITLIIVAIVLYIAKEFK